MTHSEPSRGSPSGCPVPIDDSDQRIMLAHGEGGRAMRRLVRDRIVAALGSVYLGTMDDAARLPAIDGPVAMTTDSFVVTPLFFPGGDIGKLAVFGTVNDLVVSGAEPLYLSLSLIIEEGFSLAVLDRVLASVAAATREVNVPIVTGDTKVVSHGAADGLFINTTGIGRLTAPVPPGPTSLCVGDELIVSGPIGQHGTAVLCAREELAFEPPPRSDCGSLATVAQALRSQLGPRVRAMRDATRGGLAAVLHEWAEVSQRTMAIRERDVPVSSDVRGACELLGLDALHIANEGTMLIAVQAGAAEEAIDVLRSLPESRSAACIGVVEPQGFCPVTITRTLGGPQPLDEPQGAPLPRIC